MKCATTFFLSSVYLAAQGLTEVRVDDARPVAAAIQQIQDRYRIAINYEDAPIRFAKDMVDVTDRVQSSTQKAANPNQRIRIPRGGPLSITVPASKSDGRREAEVAIRRLLRAYSASGYPGSFFFNTKTAIPTVTPTSVRDEKGRVVAVGSVLNTMIYLPAQELTAGDAVNAVLSQVQQSIGLRIGLGSGPMQTLATVRVQIGNDQGQTAAQAIDQILLTMSSRDGRGAAAVSSFSYRLLFDPGIRWYGLNIVWIRFDPQPFRWLGVLQ